jgi:hypothetical protein
MVNESRSELKNGQIIVTDSSNENVSVNLNIQIFTSTDFYTQRTDAISRFRQLQYFVARTRTYVNRKLPLTDLKRRAILGALFEPVGKSCGGDICMTGLLLDFRDVCPVGKGISDRNRSQHVPELYACLTLTKNIL